MSNVTANAVDWFVNELNKAHLIPVNAATLIRDVAAKQLGGSDFTPRPLTMDNFTNAELDAMYRLSVGDDGKSYRPITGNIYDTLAKKIGWYGDGDQKALQYLSPLRSLSTTLGQAGMSLEGGKHYVTDLYDFNKWNLRLIDRGDGKFAREEDPYGLVKTIEEWKDYVRKEGAMRKGLYHRLRSNAMEFGHNSGDPDHQKIKTKVSIEDIKKRLGDRLGKYDITGIPSKSSVVMKSMAAGAVSGVPIGAALGAMSGAIRLLDKSKRKKWVKTMLTHILAGAAIGGAVGGGAGGIGANSIFSKFEKRSADGRERAARKRRLKYLIGALAYSLPLMVLAGTATPAGVGVKRVVDKMSRDVDDTKGMGIEIVEDTPDVWGMDPGQFM